RDLGAGASVRSWLPSTAGTGTGPPFGGEAVDTLSTACRRCRFTVASDRFSRAAIVALLALGERATALVTRSAALGWRFGAGFRASFGLGLGAGSRLASVVTPSAAGGVGSWSTAAEVRAG